MVGALVLLLLAPQAALPADVDRVIAVDEREPLLVVSMSPRNVASPISSGRLFDSIERALTTQTTMTIRTPEQQGLDVRQLDACPLARRLDCWTNLARRDDDTLRRMLVISTIVERDKRVQLTAMTIDLEHAEGAKKTSKDTERIENMIYKRTVERTSDRFDPLDDNALDAAAAELLRTDTLLSRQLRGNLDLLTDRAGLTMQIDGRDVGISDIGRTRFEGLGARTRTFALVDPATQSPALSRAVDIPANSTTTLDARFEPTRGPAAGLHRTLQWVGVGVAAVGVGVGILSLTTEPPAPYSLPTPDTRTSRSFLGTCHLGGSVYEDCADGRGILLAPASLALLAAGGLTAIGYGLLAEDETFEWWWAAGGVALGILTYGALAILDGPPDL